MSRAGRMRQMFSPRGHDPAAESALYNANYGKLVKLNTAAVAGGFNIQNTTLIADVHVGQNEWMVSLSPPMRSDALHVPWQDSFAGTTTPPNTGANFQAPLLPSLGLQCLLRWSAGGVAQYAAFDYPYNGSVFGIACETLNLDVALKPGQTAVLYPDNVGSIPSLAVQMTEGAPANPRPLRWQDIRATVGSFSGGGAAVWWPVRPFARKVDFYADNTPSAGTQFLVVWTDAVGGEVFSTGWTAATAGVVSGVTLDVPPGAVAVSVQQTAGTADVSVMPLWEISFA